MKTKPTGIIVIGLIIGLFIINTFQERPNKTGEVTYYVIKANGQRIAIPSNDLLVVPLWEPNDVNDIWPEFIAEKKVDFSWGELILQSKPFILSDNSEIQGEHGRRMVYYVERKNK